MARIDGRNPDRLREISIECGVIPHAEGSVLIRAGGTHVICTATVEDKVPPFKKGSGEGWLTAEYAMIPRATLTRNDRDISKLKLNGRAAEIQRLIGRALRAVLDLRAIGERTITIDCDVIRADGGTRTASITGGFVALAAACRWMIDGGMIDRMPLADFVAATSVGIVGGTEMLDLCYVEDSAAEVDMNVVMTGDGRFVEIQATGEESTFTERQYGKLIRLAKAGILELTALQRTALGDTAGLIGRKE